MIQKSLATLHGKLQANPYWRKNFWRLHKTNPSGLSRLGLQVGLELQPCLADNKAFEMM
jgi:hypothetical protein